MFENGVDLLFGSQGICIIKETPARNAKGTALEFDPAFAYVPHRVFLRVFDSKPNKLAQRFLFAPREEEILLGLDMGLFLFVKAIVDKLLLFLFDEF